jgi:hypothetical protein
MFSFQQQPVPGKGICQLTDCGRGATALCLCCEQKVCTKHFLEHIAQMEAKIDPLASEVNNTIERIRNLNAEKLSLPVYAELNQWQKNMHELIDDIHGKKTKEIAEKLEANQTRFDEHKQKQLESIMKLEEEVRRVANDGDVTFERIQSFEKQLKVAETNLNDVDENFLSISIRDLSEDVVTISSNMDQPPPTVPSTNIFGVPIFGSTSSITVSGNPYVTTKRGGRR